MKKIVLVKRNDGSFVPAYQQDKEMAVKLKYGENIFKIGSQRNPRAHALAFALAKATLENLPEKYDHWNEMYKSNPHRAPYLFIKALQLEIGEADPIQRADGTIDMIPRSIAFEAMSEEEFEPLLTMLTRQAAKFLGVTYEEMKRNYIAHL